MAGLNQALRRMIEVDAVTHQGGMGKAFQGKDELSRLAVNCYLFEDTYYNSGENIAGRIVELVKADDVSVADSLKIAQEAKEGHLRHVPLWIINALIAAKKVKDESHTLSWRDVRQMLTRPDQATELLAMYWATVGKDKPVPAMYKKAFRDYLQTLDRYALAKYKQDGKQVQLRDVVRISRPRPKDENQAQDFSDLIKNTLPNKDTWEARLSVPGADKWAVWNSLLDEDLLGDMAVLRNIRNMSEAGVDGVKISKAIRSIKSKYITAGQIVQAFKSVPAYEAELDELFEKLFTQDRLEAEVVIMVDVSPSMDAPLSKKGKTMRYEVAAGLAAQLAMAFSRVHVYSFDTRFKQITGKGMAIIKKAMKADGDGTDCYGTWSALRDKHPNAHLIMVTDEQDGGYFRSFKASDYKADKQSFIINVAPYSVGLATDGNIERINGWSDKIPAYIRERLAGCQ